MRTWRLFKQRSPKLWRALGVEEQRSDVARLLAMNKYWADKRVCVTGRAGFLGSYVVQKLHARGCRDVFVPRSRDYALRRRSAVSHMYDDARPDIIIHLAPVVGGICANRANPGRFLYD